MGRVVAIRRYQLIQLVLNRIKVRLTIPQRVISIKGYYAPFFHWLSDGLLVFYTAKVHKVFLTTKRFSFKMANNRGIIRIFAGIL